MVKLWNHILSFKWAFFIMYDILNEHTPLYFVWYSLYACIYDVYVQ